MARTLVQSDNFNRASLGSNWTQINNWAAGDCTTETSTVLKGVGGGASGIVRNSGTIVWAGSGSFATDQYSSVTILSQGYDGLQYCAAAMVRCSGDVNTNGGQMDFYAAVVFQDAASGASHTCSIVKLSNGTETQLGATQSIVWTDGDILSIEATGTSTTTLEFFKNGVSQFSRTDSSSPLTSGKPGVILSGGISVRMDDWEGGDVVSAASSPHRAAMLSGII